MSKEEQQYFLKQNFDLKLTLSVIGTSLEQMSESAFQRNLLCSIKVQINYILPFNTAGIITCYVNF